MEPGEGVSINAYVGPIRLLAMGRRTMQFEIPEDQAVEFMACLTLFGKQVNLQIREIVDEE